MDAARETAGEVVAKYGKYNPDTPSNEHRYYVRYNGRVYYAADTDALAEKLAVVIRDETP